MNMNDFYCILLSELTVLPGAALCFFPMKNQLKTSPGKLFVRILSILLASAFLMAWVTFSFSFRPNTVLLPSLLLFYAGYHKSLTVPFSKSLAVYLYVCSLMAILSNFANGFDALCNPESGANIFSMENSLFQLSLCTAVAILCFYPMQKYGSVLIDRLDFSHVWYMTLPISALFLSINLLIRPQKYQTLYTNKVFLAFWGSISMMITTLAFLTVIFYFIVSGILREAETIEKNHILEMQKSMFLKQQDYIRATSAQRHNFRQTIRTLEALAQTGDYPAIKEYLAKYVDTMPVNDVTGFCTNHAVNALLNYYAENATAQKISLHWVVDLPEKSRIDDIDLCNTLGNLLENAVTSCLNVPEEERFLNLYIRWEEGNSFLYIAMTNSFDGKVRMHKERYLSTHAGGSGIGLSSISSIAEKYGGLARFYHEGKEFNADVAMRYV